jgi:hypothetical protein
MDTLINLENIERVTLKLSSIDKSYVWLEERPQQIVGKWWYILIGRGKKIIPYKPTGFYYNGNYDSPHEGRYSNLLIDTENKILKRKSELTITYKNSDCKVYYFISDEDAKKAFNEIKNKTYLLHIDLISPFDQN